MYPTQDLCLSGKDLVFGGSPQNNNASVQQLGHDEADVVGPKEAVDDPYNVDTAGAIGSPDSTVGLA
jgi:hypothetical protein